jgi:hypothetical protein
VTPEERAAWAQWRDAQNDMRRIAVKGLLKLHAPGMTVHITLRESPVVDEYGVVTFAEWDGWLIQTMPMIFNDRLVLTPKDNLGVYDFGWCFQKGAAAVLAALAWNPETEGEPVGFIKSIGLRARRAGERASEGWE